LGIAKVRIEVAKVVRESLEVQADGVPDEGVARQPGALDRALAFF
jgi:hypothetical protein